MPKIAVVFPSFDSAVTGMGQDIYDAFPIAKEYFDNANALLDIDVKEICFTDSQKKLKNVNFSEVCVFVSSVAILETLKDKGLNYDFVSGVGIGEVSAIYAANCFDYLTALKFVKERSTAILENSQGYELAMLQIEGISESQVSELVKKHGEYTNIAYKYSPTDFVVSGEIKDLELILSESEALGAKPQFTNKSVAQNSRFNYPAAIDVKSYLETVRIRFPQVPYIGFNGEVFDGNIKNYLETHLYNTVDFNKTVDTIISSGADLIIEIGPAKELTKAIESASKNIKVINVNSKSSLISALNVLGLNNE